MPLTLPLPLEVESKLVFLLLLPTPTLGELDDKSDVLWRMNGEAMARLEPHICPWRRAEVGVGVVNFG